MEENDVARADARTAGALDDEKAPIETYVESMRWVDFSSLIDAFRHRTGINLFTSSMSAAEAWGAYLKRTRRNARRGRLNRAKKGA